MDTERIGTVVTVTGAGNPTISSPITQALGLGQGTEVYIDDVIVSDQTTIVVESDSGIITIGPNVTVKMTEDVLGTSDDVEPYVAKKVIQDLEDVKDVKDDLVIEKPIEIENIVENDDGTSYVFVTRTNATFGNEELNELLILNESPLILPLTTGSDENIS